MISKFAPGFLLSIRLASSDSPTLGQVSVCLLDGPHEITDGDDVIGYDIR